MPKKLVPRLARATGILPFLIVLQPNFAGGLVKWVVIAVLAILLVSGCAQQPAQGPQGTNQGTNPNANNANVQQEALGNNTQGAGVVKAVANGDNVKVEYVGKFTDGNVFDQSTGKGPLEFVVGAGQMIVGFDEAVVGMKLNDEKTVTIPPEKAYGAADAPGQQVTVPVASIQGEGNLAVGATLYMGSGQQGKVIDINNGNATIEYRHPLAGKTLVFWIKVVDIQRAG